MTLQLEALIGNYVYGVLGNNPILVALIVLLVWGAFVAVLRVPALVAMLSTGLLVIILFGPGVISWAGSPIAVGGLEASGYVWFIVMFVTAIFIYLGLKATVWREY